MSLFIDRQLRAFRELQKNNDSDEMALFKKLFQIPFTFFVPHIPLCSWINIHSNEQQSKGKYGKYEVTRTNATECASDSHSCSLLMDPNQVPYMLKVIYKICAA